MLFKASPSLRSLISNFVFSPPHAKLFHMDDLDQARELFTAGNYSFVAVKDGRIVATGEHDGIGELLSAVERLPSELEGASLADKVVGKAIALVSVHAGISAIYTPLASQAALDVLKPRGTPLQADRLVPLIRNKRNDGPCPMERLTQPIDEPSAAVVALNQFVASMRQRAAEPLTVKE